MLSVVTRHTMKWKVAIKMPLG